MVFLYTSASLRLPLLALGESGDFPLRGTRYSYNQTNYR